MCQPEPTFNVVRKAYIGKDGQERYVAFHLQLGFEEEVFHLVAFNSWDEVVAYFEEMGSVERVLEDNFCWDLAPEVYISWEQRSDVWEGSVIEYFGDRKFKYDGHNMEDAE